MNTVSVKTSKPIARQKGNMLVSAAITLGVMGIITLGAMKGFEMYEEAKVTNDVQELGDLKSRTVKYGQSIGTNFTTANAALSILAGLNFWDAKRVTGTGASTAVSNQWGGSVTTAPGTTNSSGDSIDYTYTGYTSSACRLIATQIDGIVTKISIGGTSVKAANAPVNSTTVGTQCSASSNNATIVFTIKK